MIAKPGTIALRGRLLWFVEDPSLASRERATRYIEDGVLLAVDGIIREAGEASALLGQIPAGVDLTDHRPNLLCPGFIDPHLHFPQTQVIASYGAQLLDWLNKFTFVEEQKYRDEAHAARQAAFFLDELVANGTTTAVVFCSVHPQSAEAFFAESERRNMRMIAGKVMMDRNAPDALRDTAETGYAESKALIAKWHGRGRQLYAVAPRFAITSTPAQLEASGALLAEHPGCYLETHLSENPREIETVKRLFPEATDYLDVYERHGLLGPKSLFGHCIHLSEREWGSLSKTRSIAVSCPTSNLFLGSGLFDLQSARRPDRPVRVGVATDIGGGTSYSMLRTLSEAYKVSQLKGYSIDPYLAFYMMTLANAQALSLDHLIGSFEPGREADIVVLDARATPAMAHRMEAARELADELFVLIVMGDERAVSATYVMGREAKPPPKRA